MSKTHSYSGSSAGDGNDHDGDHYDLWLLINYQLLILIQLLSINYVPGFCANRRKCINSILFQKQICDVNIVVLALQLKILNI